LGAQQAPGAEPGTVVEVGKRNFEIAAGDGNVVVVHEVQPEGRRAMEACDYLAGRRMEAGEKFAKIE
jgi:methionyl-tRNA formyltransferase